VSGKSNNGGAGNWGKEYPGDSVRHALSIEIQVAKSSNELLSGRQAITESPKKHVLDDRRVTPALTRVKA
jgi:hypothetical protein